MGLQQIVLSVFVLTLAHASPAGAQCEQGGGTPVQQGCGNFTYEGCCDGERLFWCEAGWLCTVDCAANPYCGWRVAASFYACDTSGDPAPGNNPPIQCPAVDGDGDGFTEDDGDCDDSNQWVHPGAPENCGNGIDDDCDGATDAADTDCPQGDDDDTGSAGDDDDTGSAGDDDTGSADDDDNTGQNDDDDTSPGSQDQPQLNENPHLGIICGCRVAGRTPASPLVVLTLIIGALVMRKTR